MALANGLQLVMFFKPSEIPSPEKCLPGRNQAIEVSGKHLLLQRSYLPPFPEGTIAVYFGMGCFWGAERKFWQQSDVYVTAVGYAGGTTPNPTYEEVCSGMTGHTEVVLVVLPNDSTIFEGLLELFWESHDPTQGMRQGNDRGTQYRSAVYVESESFLEQSLISQEHYQANLSKLGLGKITTEIALGRDFYYAEDYHQQYLIRVPNGYCGLAGTGVCYQD